MRDALEPTIVIAKTSAQIFRRLILVAFFVCAACSGNASSGTASGPSTPMQASNPSPRVEFAYASNFGQGEGEIGTSVITYRVDPATGTLTRSGVVPFQAPNEPGQVVQIGAGGRFAYLPKSNTYPPVILIYTINQKNGTLHLASSYHEKDRLAGALTLDPSGKFGYVPDGLENDIYGYAVDAAAGGLRPLKGSPFKANANSLVVTIDPSGRFLYGGDEATDQTYSFAIHPQTGALKPTGSPVDGGYGLVIDPATKFAFTTKNNGQSLQELRYAIDPASGALEGPGKPVVADVDVFDPSGKFGWVGDSSHKRISTYAYDSGSGSFPRTTSSPLPPGMVYHCVTVFDHHLYVMTELGSTGQAFISVYAIDAKDGSLKLVPGSTVAAGYNGLCLTLGSAG